MSTEPCEHLGPPVKLRLVVDWKDSLEPHYAKDGTRCLYLMDGEAWLWEPTGCTICISEELLSRSFSSTDGDGDERFKCLRCGPLMPVPYVMRTTHRLTIGPVQREGEELVEDIFLYPVSMSVEEVEARINKMVDEEYTEPCETPEAET